MNMSPVVIIVGSDLAEDVETFFCPRVPWGLVLMHNLGLGQTPRPN